MYLQESDKMKHTMKLISDMLCHEHSLTGFVWILFINNRSQKTGSQQVFYLTISPLTAKSKHIQELLNNTLIKFLSILLLLIKSIKLFFGCYSFIKDVNVYTPSVLERSFKTEDITLNTLNVGVYLQMYLANIYPIVCIVLRISSKTI